MRSARKWNFKSDFVAQPERVPDEATHNNSQTLSLWLSAHTLKTVKCTKHLMFCLPEKFIFYVWLSSRREQRKANERGEATVIIAWKLFENKKFSSCRARTKSERRKLLMEINPKLFLCRKHFQVRKILWSNNNKMQTHARASGEKTGRVGNEVPSLVMTTTRTIDSLANNRMAMLQFKSFTMRRTRLTRQFKLHRHFPFSSTNAAS